MMGFQWRIILFYSFGIVQTAPLPIAADIAPLIPERDRLH